ncbi:hypothetical protein A3H10_04830 [Candidatus Uhrbacteria bacterium RIFCSPLOWO2_12_FULL_46_10]|nr:MAG: hypothetical protein UX68_C0010G0002 [Parcubacteria group bacterium GW2011_GWA2_46_9]OGL59441.1 MAG: hypothetical protein A2752_02655 [Candidatus Uhrbacteria bacterium RIFCSPHIGHO2_01_FULL_46_23]OGL75643.1 MAG: hypothetical protein A3E96_01230 [Candidatus Uhrbacteria bacterium RIFCSPHIGHO2_12_FULL_46_13]OGL90923.1 MAG: hypothetical protein A3H10_04830 [Candidatus Uhrbacteria bacterium RIFCSPLOWO2_12_FULL_46_10]
MTTNKRGGAWFANALFFAYVAARRVRKMSKIKTVTQQSDAEISQLARVAVDKIREARLVFSPEFEARSTALRDVILRVEDVFGARLRMQTQEMFWIRILLRELDAERRWLATLLGQPLNESLRKHVEEWRCF